MNYYNDNDPNSAACLRELISRGLIANGVVDDRSILDVQPDDLRGFTQCHFFAGIGAWSFALRLAGWPDDRPVWTGSAPCQPFSVAGLGLAVDDPRHLSPKFASLVRSCCPDVLFGEQVASAQVFGSSAKPSRKGSQGAPAWAWLDDLCDRLEAAQYAIGASDIPSAGVGAPHQRQRTFFGAIRLADLHGDGCNQGRQRLTSAGDDGFVGDGALGGLADSLGEGLEGHGGHGDDRDQSRRVGAFSAGSASSGGQSGGLADAEHDDRRSDIAGRGSEGRTADGWSGAALLLGERGRPGPTNGFWRDADWLFCRDELWRPVMPGSFPLVDRAAARVGRLRGYGNAINPWAAKVYIESFCEAAGIPLVPDYLDALGLMSLYK